MCKVPCAEPMNISTVLRRVPFPFRRYDVEKRCTKNESLMKYALEQFEKKKTANRTRQSEREREREWEWWWTMEVCLVQWMACSPRCTTPNYGWGYHTSICFHVRSPIWIVHEYTTKTAQDHEHTSINQSYTRFRVCLIMCYYDDFAIFSFSPTPPPCVGPSIACRGKRCDSLPYHFYGVILTLKDKVANYYSMCCSTRRSTKFMHLTSTFKTTFNAFALNRFFLSPLFSSFSFPSLSSYLCRSCSAIQSLYVPVFLCFATKSRFKLHFQQPKYIDKKWLVNECVFIERSKTLIIEFECKVWK